MTNKHNQEPKQSGASEKMFNPLDPLGLLGNRRAIMEEKVSPCKISLVRNDGGQPIGIEVICDTPEARSEMTAAINEFEILVKARAKEELLPGEMPGVPRK